MDDRRSRSWRSCVCSWTENSLDAGCRSPLDGRSGSLVAGQRVFGAVVQFADPAAVEPGLIDFKVGARKKLGRKLLDGETDGFRGMAKSSIAEAAAHGSPAPGGEQLRLRFIIECGHCLRS